MAGNRAALTKLCGASAVVQSSDPLEAIREAFRNAEEITFPWEKPASSSVNSQHSQDSQAVRLTSHLTKQEQDIFEERAAIMEFDGGLERAAAEQRALLLVLAGKRGR